eukprot:1194411-Prorocentrum_minimum.AAC.6
MVLTRDYLGKAHALRTTAMSYTPVPGAPSMPGEHPGPTQHPGRIWATYTVFATPCPLHQRCRRPRTGRFEPSRKLGTTVQGPQIHQAPPIRKRPI